MAHPISFRRREHTTARSRSTESRPTTVRGETRRPSTLLREPARARAPLLRSSGRRDEAATARAHRGSCHPRLRPFSGVLPSALPTGSSLVARRRQATIRGGTNPFSDSGLAPLWAAPTLSGTCKFQSRHRHAFVLGRNPVVSDKNRQNRRGAGPS